MTLAIMTFNKMTLISKNTLSSMLWYPATTAIWVFQKRRHEHHYTQQNDTLTKRYPEFSVVVHSNPRYMGVSNKAPQISLYKVCLSFGNAAFFYVCGHSVQQYLFVVA